MIKGISSIEISRSPKMKTLFSSSLRTCWFTVIMFSVFVLVYFGSKANRKIWVRRADQKEAFGHRKTQRNEPQMWELNVQIGGLEGLLQWREYPWISR